MFLIFRIICQKCAEILKCEFFKFRPISNKDVIILFSFDMPQVPISVRAAATTTTAVLTPTVEHYFTVTKHI